MRRTVSLLSLAVAFMSNPRARRWGYELSKETGLRSGVLYPILQRLLADGWIEDGWEDIDPKTEGRPARRYYSVTDLGMSEFASLTATAASARPKRQVGFA